MINTGRSSITGRSRSNSGSRNNTPRGSNSLAGFYYLDSIGGAMNAAYLDSDDEEVVPLAPITTTSDNPNPLETQEILLFTICSLLRTLALDDFKVFNQLSFIYILVLFLFLSCVFIL